MPVSDLLWACPVCGEDRGLRNDRSICRRCGTRFLRGPRATIRALAPDGDETVRSASEWLGRLADPSSLLDRDPIRNARVSLRSATEEANVYGEGGYLNRIEIFGKEIPATIRLEADRLIVEHDAAAEAWPFETFTAVQTSSKSLQLKRRAAPVAAFRFQDDSVFLWEQLIRGALRRFYGRTGRGEIREFQPRIETR